MKDASMSLGIYFEIKDAELYGGEGTTGYAATIVEISIEGLQNADFEKYANSQQWRSDVQQGFIPARFAAREHRSATRTVTGAERSSPGTEKHTQTATTHI